MEFRILGPVVVRGDAGEALLGGVKRRGVLAVLLLHPNEPVSVERLVIALFGEDAPPSAIKAVRVHVSRLRRALGEPDLLTTTAAGYRLRVRPGELDAERFERLVDEARGALRAGQPRRAGSVLREALALWHGPPLAELETLPFAAAEISRLEEQRLAALEMRLEADLATGRHAELIGELQRLTSMYPLRERLYGQLMQALYRSGRQADALQVYRRARSVFLDELGLEPGSQLRELEQAVLRQDARLEFASAAEPTRDGSRGPFVGRGRELTELLGALEDAIAGRGRLCLIGGEPGIGKSRLADEVSAHARARGARVLVGRCWEAGGAPAYWPWVQSLRSYVRDAETAALRSQLGAGAGEVAQLVPELPGRLPELPAPLPLEAEGARFRMFDATTEFVRNACGGRPMVLVLDDLHAADAPSLLLLQFLARELASIPLLVIAAYRDVDPRPGQPLTELLAVAVREPVTSRLTLAGLTEREVSDYATLTAPGIVSAELVGRLHEETEGNPLFVGEIVRLLAIEGIPPAGTAGIRLTVPESLRDVIARRLAHLSTTCRRVLALASVLGREFALAPLARIAGVSEDELLDVLDEAMAARVAADVPAGGARMRFSHALIRDTLYDGLTSARRVQLHRQAVTALETVYGEQPGPHLNELAHHSLAGREYDKARQYAQRAGDHALTLLAFEESARLYETAIQALGRVEQIDEPARCELMLSLGEAQARAGRSTVAKQTFLEAAELAERLGLGRELARAAAGYGGRSISERAGDDDRLVPLLEAGLAALTDDDVELRARLLARLAGALRDEPSRERRDRLSREAVALARRSGNPAALVYALDGRTVAMLAPDTMEECDTLGREQCRVAERIGDKERLFHGHEHRLIAHVTLGDARNAALELHAMSRLGDELRQPVQSWHVLAWKAMQALTEGRLTEADELVAAAGALGERAQPDMAIPVHRLQRYAAAELRGQLEEVLPDVQGLVDEYPGRPVLRCVLAHLHAGLGRPREAKQLLDELAQDGFAVLPFDSEWLYGMSLLAETSARLHDTATASALYTALLPYAAFNAADVPEAARGSVARHLGILATTTRRWEDAERHFEAALTMNERLRARPWLARTQNEYARMLLMRNERGRHQRAQELLNAARATYRAIGMDSARSTRGTG